MKQSFILFILFFSGFAAANGQTMEVLGDVGYTLEGKKARAVMHADVKTDGNYTYFEVHNGYSFGIRNEDCADFAKIIDKYLLEDGEETVVLGSFVTHHVTGVSDVENVTSPGKYETTYAKGTEIELRYDGEDLWIHIPETKFLRFTAAPIDIRIFQDYIDAFYEAYNQ